VATRSPHPLDGVREKLTRAGEQMVAIEEHVHSLIASNQYRVTGHAHHDLREYSFTAYGPPVSARFSVLAGEVIHHLRSCLDHLVWQLVVANGQQPTERNEFPICDTATRFAEACRRGKLRGVSASAQTRIESLQPYHSTKVEDNCLWVIHELDRIDKHRLLVVVLAVVGIGQKLGIGSNTGPLEIIGMSPPDKRTPTEDGVEVFRVSFGQYQRDVRVEPEFNMELAIDRVGAVTRPPLLQVLRGALDNLAAIIEGFNAEFAAAGS